MTLEEASQRIGERAIYRPYPGATEVGIITRVTEKYVFVRYGSEQSAKATRAEDLEPWT
jgi:hypothetical protein